MRVYTSKLTPDSVVTYLFHDCERSLWLFCLVWSKFSTPRLTARTLPVLRVCAMFGRLTFRFGFRVSLLNFTSRIERLHVCYYWADVWSILAYFCRDAVQSRTSIDRQVRSGHRHCVCRSFSWRAWPISCSHSTVAVCSDLWPVISWPTFVLLSPALCLGCDNGS